ncbi:hypothetical protein [uncultured Cohaesibacter sp.]|nr:hypothetical protein [uncultured Cohaesibacter sp.]
MFDKSKNPIFQALKIFTNLGSGETRIHPDRRDWEAMTFYRREEK